MPRVKRGTIHVKKEKNFSKRPKGFKWNRKNTIRHRRDAAVRLASTLTWIAKEKAPLLRYLWQIKIELP